MSAVTHETYRDFELEIYDYDQLARPGIQVYVNPSPWSVRSGTCFTSVAEAKAAIDNHYDERDRRERQREIDEAVKEFIAILSNLTFGEIALRIDRLERTVSAYRSYVSATNSTYSNCASTALRDLGETLPCETLPLSGAPSETKQKIVREKYAKKIEADIARDGIGYHLGFEILPGESYMPIGSFQFVHHDYAGAEDDYDLRCGSEIGMYAVLEAIHDRIEASRWRRGQPRAKENL